MFCAGKGTSVDVGGDGGVIYILMILAILNGLISIGAIILLYIEADEVTHTSIGVAALFLVNAWFFGVAAYLV